MTAPIAHYKLNGDANDASGNGNDGTPTVITYDVGKIGQAASFNGTTSKIDCNSDYLPLGPLTICMWIKLSGWGGGNYGRLFGNGRVALYTYTNGGLSFWSAYAGGGSAAVTGAGAVSLGPWFHIAITRDANALTNFFINAESSGAADQDTSPIVSGTTNVIIGNRNDSARAVDGLIDDVRIDNRILPQWEIEDIVNFDRGTELCEPSQRLILPTYQQTIQPLIAAA